MKIIIIAGSQKDSNFVEKLEQLLLPLEYQTFYISAHKNTQLLLDTVKTFQYQKVIFVTLAGKSNALSGVVACNTTHPVIACPIFLSDSDYITDIHSTLRMPSNTPVLTVLSLENCALAVKRIHSILKI